MVDHIPESRNYKGNEGANRQKLIPAKELRRIKVGGETGKAIEKSYKGAIDSSGRTVKAHIRKAHWHGYWTGKKDGSEVRKYDYKFIPPTLINFNKG